MSLSSLKHTLNIPILFITAYCACRLEFLENLDIVSIFSSEGEKVAFSSVISTSQARGAVEKWLLQVEDTMVVSLRDIVAKARDVSNICDIGVEDQYCDKLCNNVWSESEHKNGKFAHELGMFSVQTYLESRKICAWTAVNLWFSWST